MLSCTTTSSLGALMWGASSLWDKRLIPSQSVMGSIIHFTIVAHVAPHVLKIANGGAYITSNMDHELLNHNGAIFMPKLLAAYKLPNMMEIEVVEC